VEVKQLNDSNFKSVAGEAEIALVMFSAPWAGPCNMVRPAFESVASRFGNQIVFGEFVLDDNPATPERYGVKQVPAFYLLRDGIPETIKAGAVPETVLVDLCEAAINA
jgi:thioredoxin 1